MNFLIKNTGSIAIRCVFLRVVCQGGAALLPSIGLRIPVGADIIRPEKLRFIIQHTAV